MPSESEKYPIADDNNVDEGDKSVREEENDEVEDRATGNTAAPPIHQNTSKNTTTASGIRDSVVPDATTIRRRSDLQDDFMERVGGENIRRRSEPPPVGGDFPDDLLPSGVPLPGFADPVRVGGRSGTTGNLMGPNHPMFHPPNFGRGNYDEDYIDEGRGDFITPGGLGMQPRFDPYYPPGVGRGRMGFPGRHGRGRGQGRGGSGFWGGGGDPNPDHQRPPNTFGNNNNNGGGGAGWGNMFM